MKKIISFAVTVCAVATLFAVSRPSLDGRAVVADTGVMPKGMFARTIGYLPGDSVAVTNPATGSSVDVLVLGAVDPSDGVAILLSPEAADRLQIRKNANVQVKITKRTGSPDEAVFGTAVLAEGDDLAYADDAPPVSAMPAPVAESPLPAEREDAAVLLPEEPVRAVSEDPVVAEYVLPPVLADDFRDDEAAYIPDIPEIMETATPAAEVVVAANDVPDPAEDAAQPVVIEYSPYPTDALADINIIVKEVTDGAPPAAGEEERYDDIDVDTYLDDLAESLQGERVFAEELPDSDDAVAAVFTPDALDEIGVEDYDPYADDTPVAEELEYVFDDLEDDDEEIEYDFVVEDYDPYADDSPVAEELEYVFDDFEDDDEETEYDFVWYDDDDAACESPVEEAYLRDDVAPAFEDVARSEKFTADIELERTDSVAAGPKADSDAYQSIVLVPAPENPPESEDNPADDPASVVPIVAVPEQSPAGMEQYIVPSLKELQDGAYYVQISTLSNPENIETVLDTYADTYPLVIVPLESGAAYQILVGPLGVDEYGTVQSKFKAFGFKDAFLRKIRGSRTPDAK